MVPPTLFYGYKPVSSFEIYRKFDTSSGISSLILERTTVHVSDDSGRIAMLEKRTIGTDDSPPTLTRYVYSNHLQSASLELDGIGDIISYEEIEPARFANTKRSIKHFVGNIILMVRQPSRLRTLPLMP